ncbi:putative LRR receptor-like serine/threonine-protein kinaseisoform X1 [Iris pallida]|uniref:LRR receptor-like serine/threonine-protein kinaseisoform X1 n=1 Tax=Iris pallida TaxID=29817 RepID=A0AAX6G3L4_IRIPA|nr:putative LRR receptor-like serine/threonine-protein kinaseisoform X1 [Iris pallida]
MGVVSTRPQCYSFYRTLIGYHQKRKLFHFSYPFSYSLLTTPLLRARMNSPFYPFVFRFLNYRERSYSQIHYSFDYRSVPSIRSTFFTVAPLGSSEMETRGM